MIHVKKEPVIVTDKTRLMLHRHYADFRNMVDAAKIRNPLVEATINLSIKDDGDEYYIFEPSIVCESDSDRRLVQELIDTYLPYPRFKLDKGAD